jgi:predicted dehydrogenase
MKFLIAGLGSIGKRHLQNLATLGEFDLTVYRTNRSTVPQEDLPDFKVVTDLGKALSQKPDAVIIANPTALHMEVAVAAAKAGCHLFLEKPISHNLDQIKELKALLKTNELKCFVGFQYRFHPGLQKIVELIRCGAIGRPLSARALWGEYLPGWHPWEDYRKGYSARSDLGGGVVLTLCHPLDYLRWMLGEVEQLWAFTGKISDLEINVEDYAEIGLRFANGAVGNLHLDYFRRPPEHRLDIVGSEGTIEWRAETGVTRLYRPVTDAWESFLPPQGFSRNDLFLAEMRHFLEMISGEHAPIATLEDGEKSLILANAVLISAKSKKMINISKN